MKDMKGPGIFLAQFMGQDAPFDTLENMAQWAAGLGYVGVQIPCNAQLIDLKTAAESRDYCDDLRAKLDRHGIAVTELSTHLQGQLVAVHPAYDTLFDGFAPPEVHGKPAERQAWAVEQVKMAARASANLGLSAHATFPGALAWPYVYPWPQRPAGLVEEAFAELARRWVPILDVFEDAGVDCAFEVHAGEDVHDGASWERFLAAVNEHPRARLLFDPSHFVLQQLDYLDFIDRYHDRISCFHVKDAEFNPTGRSGVYGGYQDWVDRAGRFRSLGDGQVDFSGIFTRMAQYGYAGWAVLEWECALKRAEDGAREGAPFIRDHIIRVTDHPFDDFAKSGVDRAAIRSILGLSTDGGAA
ncbi:sugar phosphate isomerase/epimerase family protein [Sphingomonas carotinifaciens]|uniref:Sugar phosphate isomerase/epimerase n=1 Tax=Sphingomonas carotinifaciens TaxID=1166323 RepID=A0A1G7P6T6_9SPHN|nr:sugar phosphate isomerase/epimerase [Sphingomonas carotinifaciens]MBB4087330.1 sugar phosphate isomerase/epimerase [Sphingomonas carotinifaciens]MWC44645.1 TIM barrel protein [Sphingomonas carotinifaciens]SDF82012.1 Sugar phosphate isomerase/epimerase [Sphingomonas carotinifaciens]